VLQRRESEWIDITTADGTRIEVCVVEIRKAGGDKPKARLGFVAPKNVTVHRREVSIRIAADKELDRDDQG
jgi:sRNA-binding carbon storage regulator CsrA